MNSKRLRNILSFIGLSIAMFMGTLDSTIVNIALPKIMRAFGSSLNDTSWVTTIYVLSLSVFMITSSKVADRIGRKKVMLCGLVLFGGFSTACMLAPSLELLIVFRFVQGIGGAIITPLALPMGIEAFGKKHISILSAAVGAITALAAAGGPPIGGVILQVSTWRWVFGINVPLAIVAIIFVFFFTNESYDETLSDKTDPFGTVLLTASLGGISFGLLQGRQMGWHSMAITGSLLIGMLSLIAFIFVERKVISPVIELTLFKNKAFASSTIVYFVTGFGLVCPTLVFNYFLQDVMNYAPLHAAMLIIPVSLTVMFAMPLGTRIMDVVGAVPVNLTGMLLVSMSLFSFAAIDTNTATEFIVMLMILNGFGFGFSTILIVSSLNHLPKEKSGIGSGIVNAARQIGTCLGIALLVTVLDTQIEQAKRQVLNSSEKIVMQARLSPHVESTVSRALRESLVGNKTQPDTEEMKQKIKTAASNTANLPLPTRRSDLYALYKGSQKLANGQLKASKGVIDTKDALKQIITTNPQFETSLDPFLTGLMSIESANDDIMLGQANLATAIKLLAQKRVLKKTMTSIDNQTNEELSSAFGKTYVLAGIIVLLCAPIALFTDSPRKEEIGTRN
ncbi:MFS transporter [Lacticaseibacillus paracasei]|uniref:MFS transporter n=1 Tax=Lacticaseibacillus paracasei TaxID=1597 RepID=UPI0022EC8A85|nr:MFS transporter [Lacticaseibacillus paracasei]WBS99681.1 MFS transporter [Lacticaseibacillus paracasei]